MPGCAAALEQLFHDAGEPEGLVADLFIDVDTTGDLIDDPTRAEWAADEEAQRCTRLRHPTRMDAEEFQRQLQFGQYGGMGIIHERHVAIYQLIDNPESFSEMPFSRSAVTQISCAENDVANTYFKRAFDPNFKNICFKILLEF